MPLVPSDLAVVGAMCRGGWEHGDAEVFAIKRTTGECLIGSVNYIKGTPFEFKDPPLNTWKGDYSFAHIKSPA